MVQLLTTILLPLFPARVLCKCWSVSQSFIWWKDVVSDRIASQTPNNSLNIIVELLSKGTLLFTLASGTILYGLDHIYVVPFPMGLFCAEQFSGR